MSGAGSETRIPVGGPEPYEVVVGSGLLGEQPGLLAAMVSGAAKVLVLHAEVVADGAATVARALGEAGVEVVALAVPGTEEDKDETTVSLLWDVFGGLALSRSDAVVTVGGGSTTDVGGFAAATWLRGVRVVHVPTTLLGMVDAAVGGKTGINTAAGKNLVGSFHPPAGVICDLDFLPTLPAEDYRAGLAEVVKAGFIADPTILELLAEDPRRHERELIERAVRVKADVVTGDLREAGRREILNYGHTLGHALERVEDYSWRHGDAVAVGMVFAAELGRLTGRLDAPTADRHRQILSALGLPVSYDEEAWPALHDAMRVDKKSRGGRLRFVVLDGLARPGTLDDPPPELLAAAFAEVARG